MEPCEEIPEEEVVEAIQSKLFDLIPEEPVQDREESCQSLTKVTVTYQEIVDGSLTSQKKPEDNDGPELRRDRSLSRSRRSLRSGSRPGTSRSRLQGAGSESRNKNETKIED